MNRSSNFQWDTFHLAEHLKQIFPEIDFFKEGPSAAEIKTNIVGKDGEYYLKAFTARGIKQGATELELINLFNDFSKKTGSPFSWPEILDTCNAKDQLWFLMKDIIKSWKTELLFSDIPQKELLDLYTTYRETFAAFESFSKGKFATEKAAVLQKMVSILRTLKKQIKGVEVKSWLINVTLKNLIPSKIGQKIAERIEKGKIRVSKVMDYDEKELFLKFKELKEAICSYHFEYTFWRFWTGHVFSDGKEHQLVDFDNVGYQLEGTEFLGMMRSNLLLSVHNYSSYDEWKLAFELWHQKLLENTKDEALARLLLFQKLVGTIFMDFGYLIPLLPQNRDALIKKGLDPEIVAQQGIQWNFQLLREIFYS